MNKKRQLLIDTALKLFYTNGINSIGINEILKVSGVAKKTLYSHFDSKEALILAALEQRHSIFVLWLTNKLKSAESDQQVIFQLFKGLESWFTHSEPELGNFRGCFFINSSAEFANPANNIHIFCKQHKEEVKHIISQKISDNPLLLDAICIMKEGCITTAHITNDPSCTAKCIHLLTDYISK